jgi:hypothetical protein
MRDRRSYLVFIAHETRSRGHWPAGHALLGSRDSLIAASPA